MELKNELNLTNRYFVVDLSYLAKEADNAGTAPTQVIETEGWLELPKDRGFLWFTTALPKGKFSYEIILGESELTINGNPIECSIRGSKRDYQGEFDVDGCRTDFTLFFNPSAIIDCPDTIDCDRSYKLPFSLVLKDLEESDSENKVFEDHLEVTIKAFKPSLKFQFISDRFGNNKLMYSTECERLLQVGKLRVIHNATFTCAPDIINQSFLLNCILKEHPDNSDEHKTERTDVLLMRFHDNDTTRASIPCLGAGKSVDIPVLINMANVNNPHSTENPDFYELTVHYDSRAVCVGGFDLHRNSMLTKRKSFFTMPKREGGTITHDITMYNSFDLGELFLTQQADMEYTLTLSFMNEADATDEEHPNAAVLVWDVRIDSVTGDTDRIKTRNGKNLKDIFKLSADKSNWALNPRLGNSCNLYIKLKAGDIVGIIPHHDEKETFADLSLHLKYHAKEDSQGEFYQQVINGKTTKLHDVGQQSCDLDIRLKKQPQSEWLCVDFGTSAVVAAYARDTLNDKKSLIDLRKLKKHLLDIAYQKDDVKNSIEDEDDNLISSTVCFNNDPDTMDFRNIDGTPNSFKKYPVWFSPSVEDIWRDYLLPCLKTIIGYKHLPNIFTEDSLKKFKYRCGEDIIGLVNENGDHTALMEVSEVAKTIYRQLFKYYLSQRFGRNGLLEPRAVNKLVLSVPNTFTPLNIQAVKDLARDSMPGIYPEYLLTISESDAVACYYVSHQNEFLNSVKDDAKRIKLTNKENVLVYDMGAGTLDLTWFVKKTQKDENGRITQVDVNILGKLGVSKAGNYLDYELAGILREIYLEKTSKNGAHKKKYNNDDKFELAMLLDRTEAFGRKADSQDRMELKNYVKELKKGLSDPNAVVPRLEIGGMVYIDGEQNGDNNTRRQQGVKLKMKDILENKHFKQIINEMTQEVLQNFGERYGDKNGKLDIDVLIFSGRSTSLKAIREGVKEHISSICHKPEELLYADLCAGQLSTDILQTFDIDNSQLKTVVTQGALAYATMFSREGSNYQLHSNKYYASFGLVKYYTNRSFEYVPLIDDRKLNKVYKKNGTITSSVYKVCTNNLTQVDLIQSYSSHEEEDYKAGNFDTISKLCELPCQGFDDFDVQLIMNIQSDNSEGTTLTFKVGQGCNSLDPHDDFNNLSLRKSLWPVIFDNGENPNR